MIFSPSKEEYFSLLNLLGQLLIILGGLLIIPALIAFFLNEVNPLFDFLISIFICTSAGLLLMAVFSYGKDLEYSLTFLFVALLWVVIPLFAALPLWLSGHFGSFLDAFFDSMSGFATTGLSLIQDVDHLSFSVNFWRHFMMFLGGQGIVIVAISFAVKASSYSLGLYVGEAREERLLPNIISTARFIWLVSLTYFIVGSIVLFGAGLYAGVPVKKAAFHGVFLFMAAFDTGGFTPQSMNVFYYHSFIFEIATVIFMLLGSLNFNLHYFLWMKKRGEVFKNIETRTFFISMSILLALLSFGLLSAGSNAGFGSFFRKSFYQLVTAHTGCGFSNISVSELSHWPSTALIFVMLAMAIGGGIGSTTGGIKLMRLAVLAKSIISEVKSWLFPSKVKIYEKYHHLQDVVLEDKKIRLVFIVSFFYISSYFIGALMGMFCGYPFLESLFESVSAAANVGLSVGITSASMPAVLKVVYILQMWAGRLEFISIIVGVGVIFSSFKK